MSNACYRLDVRNIIKRGRNRAIGADHQVATRTNGNDLASHFGNNLRSSLTDLGLAVESTDHRAIEQLVRINRSEWLAIDVQRKVDHLARIIQITCQVVHLAFPVADMQDGELCILGGLVHYGQVVGLRG